MATFLLPAANPAPSTGTSGSFYQGRLILTQTPNVAARTSTIAWEFRIWANTTASSPSNYSIGSGNYVTVVINGQTVFGKADVGRVTLRNTTASNYVTLASGTTTVAHNADGKKTIAASALYEQAQAPVLKEIPISGSVTLEPIAAVAVLDPVPNMTLTRGEDAEHLISWTPTEDCYYKVQYLYGSTVLNTSPALEPDTMAHFWMISSTNLDTITSYIQTGRSITLTVALHSYRDAACTNEAGVSSAKFTATLDDSFAPTISNLTLAHSSTPVIGGSTTTSVSWNTAFTSGATLASSYAVYIDSSSNEVASRVSGASPVNLGALPAITDTSKSYKVLVSVTDSRGFTVTATSSAFTAYGWSAPSITALSAVRCQADGTESLSGGYYKLSVTYSIRPLGNANAKNMAVKYRYASAVLWTESSSGAVANYSGTLSLGPYTLSSASDEKLEVAVDVWDSFSANNKTTVSVMILPPSVFIDILTANGGETKKGIGIGKVAEKANTIQSTWGLEFFDDNDNLTGKFTTDSNGVKTAIATGSDLASTGLLDVVALFGGTEIACVVAVSLIKGNTTGGYGLYFWTNNGTPSTYKIIVKRTDGGTIASGDEIRVVAIPA